MRIFITGISTGIGFELAKTYLEQGHEVGGCARNLSKITFTHPKLFLFSADVGRSKEMKQALELFGGPIDLLIANAGRSVGVKSKTIPLEVIEEIIQTNVLGVIYTIQEGLPYLQKPGGQIAVISSVAGLVGLPGAGAYSASKAAASAYAESMALDLKSEGITVTTILPGFIDTPLTRQNHHPMPFILSSEKAAQMIAKAIAEKKATYLFPFPMKIVMSILHHMPRTWYRFLISLKPFNYRVDL